MSSVDKRLEDLSSKRVMQANGWNMGTITRFGGRDEDCGKDIFYGFNDGNTGSMTATFVGSGKATLEFGCCHAEGTGYVYVYLNGLEIKNTVGNGNKMTELTFQYAKADVLKIKESSGTIKLYSLKLVPITT